MTNKTLEFVIGSKDEFIGFYTDGEAADAASVKHNGSVYDYATLGNLSLTALARLYNSLTGDSLKKFSTKEAGVRRVTEILKQKEAEEATKQEATKQEATKQEATKQKGTKQKGTTQATAAKKIKLIPQPDKRWNEGSVRHKCFQLLEDDMKVEDYLKKCKRHHIEEPVALAALNKMVTHPDKPVAKLIG